MEVDPPLPTTTPPAIIDVVVIEEEIDLFDESPVKNVRNSPPCSPSRKRVKGEPESSGDEQEKKKSPSPPSNSPSPPPSPKVRHKRECAEAAKKKIIKQEIRPEEVREQKQGDNVDSREGSCERSDCPVQKTCCLSVSENCIQSFVDVLGKMFHHISKSEHICQTCYDVIWKPGQRFGARFAAWKAAWSEESRCNPGVKSFVLDQLLPYWLKCIQCHRFRPFQTDDVITNDQIRAYVCPNCEDPEDISVADASEHSWILSIAASPLMQNSPCLHYLKGGHYFYDELGMSPVECKYETTGCASSAFMSPFNIPDQQSKALCLRPDVMEYDEAAAFPEYSIEPVVYLAIRNLIVALWNLNPFQYLTMEDCGHFVICRGLSRVWYLSELARVHEFLRVKSIINYGVLEIPKTVRVKGERPPLDVIIVGAGISGLAAARQLRAFGASVKVLEAKAHFGGRMKDDWSLGVAVGCGAQLVTGTLNNPIILMCEQTGVDYRIVDGPCPLIDGEEGRLVDAKLDKYVFEHFDCCLDALYKWRMSTKGSDASLQDQFSLVHRTLLKKGNIRWGPTEERVLQFHLGNSEFSCGAKMADVSWRQWDQNEAVALFAGQHALLTEGSSELLKRLAEGTDVRTHHEVARVDWGSGRKKAMVTCKDGKKFTADKVLMALPLAVLKKNSVVFSPALPSKKNQALGKIGAGLIEKVAVRFPRRFWASALSSSHAPPHSHATPSNPSGEFNYFSLVPKKGHDRGMFNMFYDFSNRNSPLKHQHYVLMSYVCGDSVDIVNEMSDVEVVAKFVEVLKDMFPAEDIPEPDGHVVTHWGRDPHIGMSYAYVKVGGVGEHYDWLAESLDSRLYFAGECTNRFFPQTMTGAYLSGMREAGKMVEHQRAVVHL